MLYRANGGPSCRNGPQNRPCAEPGTVVPAIRFHGVGDGTVIGHPAPVEESGLDAIKNRDRRFGVRGERASFPTARVPLRASMRNYRSSLGGPSEVAGEDCLPPGSDRNEPPRTCDTSSNPRRSHDGPMSGPSSHLGRGERGTVRDSRLPGTDAKGPDWGTSNGPSVSSGLRLDDERRLEGRSPSPRLDWPDDLLEQRCYPPTHIPSRLPLGQGCRVWSP